MNLTISVDDEILERARKLAQVDVDRILGAIDLHGLHTLSFWDALVVHCAAAAGCAKVLSEDMNPGQMVAGVRIENPFAASVVG